MFDPVRLPASPRHTYGMYETPHPNALTSAASQTHAGYDTAPPPAPEPSRNIAFSGFTIPEKESVSPTVHQEDDIFKASPLAALQLLSASIEALETMTGDLPPTLPPTSPSMPNTRGMPAEKEKIMRPHSEKTLARLMTASRGNSPRPEILLATTRLVSPVCSQITTQLRSASVPYPLQQVDGVCLRARPSVFANLRSENRIVPYSEPSTQVAKTREAQVSPYLAEDEDTRPIILQHLAITRRFYSKKPPNISVTDYLRRVHQFCPMSTGVYLATSLYIHRLAVTTRAIAVTRRNVHRLLLGGLRVAMKALEDKNYALGRFAKVGGVSGLELARLEISFCFLTGFELAVDLEVLTEQWRMLKQKGWATRDDASFLGAFR